METLMEQGFGVLTEIDVKNVLKEKLGMDRKSYKILGACNPHFAHKAIDIEPKNGTLRPCNVLVYEKEDWEGSGNGDEPRSRFKTR